jgi:hypothetical protein
LNPRDEIGNDETQRDDEHRGNTQGTITPGMAPGSCRKDRGILE